MDHYKFVHQSGASLPQCSSLFIAQFFAPLSVCEVSETPSKCRISWVCHFTVQYKSLTVAKRKCRAKPLTKDWRFLGAIVESSFCNLGILQIILKSLMFNIWTYSLTTWLYDYISRFYTRKIWLIRCFDYPIIKKNCFVENQCLLKHLACNALL